MIKDKLKWWLVLLWIELVLWLMIALYIHYNYIKFTKEISKTENIINTQIEITWFDFKTKNFIKTWSNSIVYSWIFWTVKYTNLLNWTGYIYKKISYENLDLKVDEINKYCILNQYLYSWIIDIYIYDYFSRRNIWEFNSFLNNIIKVNNYLNINIGSFKFDETKCLLSEIDLMLNSKDYLWLIKKLNLFQSQISNNYKNVLYKKKALYLDFFQTPEFAYLIDRFVIDKDSFYRNNLDSVSSIFWISKNLIRSAILSEQVRGFFTYRWYVKDIIKSNKLLMVMSQFSYGIWWIKESTAVEIEKFISDSYPEIYKQYFWSWDSRIGRLTKSDFHQILYVGWLLRSILDKRQKGWFDISNQYWIVITLYNYWNPLDKVPHANPMIWGAVLNIDNKEYSFGALWMILYYYLEIYYPGY